MMSSEFSIAFTSDDEEPFSTETRCEWTGYDQNCVDDNGATVYRTHNPYGEAIMMIYTSPEGGEDQHYTYDYDCTSGWCRLKASTGLNYVGTTGQTASEKTCRWTDDVSTCSSRVSYSTGETLFEGTETSVYRCNQ